jgi:hypothetical protein
LALKIPALAIEKGVFNLKSQDLGWRITAKATEESAGSTGFAGYSLGLQAQKKVQTCVLTVDLCRAEGKFGKKVVGVETVSVTSL